MATANKNLAGAPAATADVVDATEIAQRSDTRPVMRLGFWVLVVGFGLFLAWAAFAPLDEGVSAPATVSIETRRKTVQHMSGGVVKAVLVREGTAVKEGELLIELEDSALRATQEAARQNYLAQRAMESRLLAEIAGAGSIAFHPDLRNSKDPLAAQHMQVQQQLFNARRSAQTAEIAAAQQTILGLENQLSGAQQVLENRRTQAALQAQQLANVKELSSDGYAPRNQALQLEQAQAELKAAIGDLQNTMQRLRSGIAETRLRIAQRQQEFLTEVSAQLAELQREVSANQDKLAAVSAELARTQIRAPVAGQVLGLTINGVGGVVTSGQRLMDIVPQGEMLLLDAHVPPSTIDRVKQGDQVEVRFSSFANAPQLVVHGRLASLSADAVTEQQGGAVVSYYLGRVELTPEGRQSLGDRQLQPGMPAEVLIKTGERSLLTYLLHPLTKRIAAAMTEE